MRRMATMATMAMRVSYYRVQLKSRGGLNEDRLHSHRLNSFPRGIPAMGGSHASTAVSNAILRRHRFNYATRPSRKRPVTTCALNTGSSPGASPEEDSSGPFGLGATRLKRIIQNGSNVFVNRFKRSRKNFPSKIFLLLLGYYTANALATVLGQTGDWDVLAAGILVALIEGVGYLMYRAPTFIGERGKDLVVLVNYYKSGFSFGLFVDAFKLGS